MTSRLSMRFGLRRFGPRSEKIDYPGIVGALLFVISLILSRVAASGGDKEHIASRWLVYMVLTCTANIVALCVRVIRRSPAMGAATLITWLLGMGVIWWAEEVTRGVTGGVRELLSHVHGIPAAEVVAMLVGALAGFLFGTNTPEMAPFRISFRRH